jgi:hypothetical protein
MLLRWRMMPPDSPSAGSSTTTPPLYALPETSVHVGALLQRLAATA